MASLILLLLFVTTIRTEESKSSKHTTGRCEYRSFFSPLDSVLLSISAWCYSFYFPFPFPVLFSLFCFVWSNFHCCDALRCIH